jgi:hypothetical protein
VVKRILAVAVTLAFAIPAFASSRPTVEEDPQQVVCKRNKETGSRVRTQRVCMTRAEWWRLEVAVREDLYEFMRRASLGVR